MASDLSAVVNQLQTNNQQQAQMDNALLTQAVQTKEVLLTSLGKLGESLRETLDETSDAITGAVLAPKDDGKLASQEAETQNEQSRLFSGILGGITGLGKKFGNFTTGFLGSLKDKGKQGLSGIMGTLKKLAIGGALLGIMAFLNSKYWEDTKKFISEDVIPALISFYDNVLVPIGNVIKDVFIKQWENIKELFSGIGDAITKFQEGDILGGITTLITSLSTFFINTIDNLITGVYNLFAEFFGFEKTDSVFGEIKRFVVDTYNGIVKFFSNAFNFATDVISGAWTSTKDFVQGIFDSIVGFFTGAFDFASDLVIGAWTNTKDFIQGVFDSVTSFFTETFTFVKDAAMNAYEGVSSFVSNQFDNIKGTFDKSYTFAKSTAMNAYEGVTSFASNTYDSAKGVFDSAFGFGKSAAMDTYGGFQSFTEEQHETAKKLFSKAFNFASEKFENFSLSDFFFGEDGVIPSAIKKITDMFAMTSDFLADFNLGDMAGNFMRGLLQAVLPPPDFLTITTPSIKNPITGNDLISAKTMNLNPIPDAMYKLAGINPKSGRTFADENAEAQAELQKAMEEMYGPSATPGDALYSGETGRSGDTYITYTDASDKSVSNESKSSTYVPLENPSKSSSTSRMDD